MLNDCPKTKLACIRKQIMSKILIVNGIKINKRTHNLIGRVFGKLIVLYPMGYEKDGMRWMVRCECGKENGVKGYSLLRGDSVSCGSPLCRGQIQDLTGRKFGKLIVLRMSDKYVKGRCTFWIVRCECGVEKCVVANTLIVGHSKSCGNPRCNGMTGGCGDVTLDIFSAIKAGATRRSRQLQFDVTPEYLWELFQKQEGKCALSGLELDLAEGRRHRHVNGRVLTASLDRIDSAKGYLEGNVQWVHKDINIMKFEMSNEDFIELCQKITSNKNKQIFENIINISPTEEYLKYFSQAKRNAKFRGISFDLDSDMLWKKLLSTNQRCTLSGSLLEFFDRDKTSYTRASLDRIDSSKGYTIDNVQWVDLNINLGKSELSNEKYIEYCEHISNNFKKEVLV